MKTRLWALAIAVVAAASVGLHSQQQPSAPASALPSPPQREPAWAFPVQAGSLPAEAPEAKSVEGSTKQYTPGQIDDLLNPPDWFPDAHKPAPSIVQKGHAGALACGACHLMSGFGHPESADLTGFTADYFVQQMNDFKAGVRKDYARMNGIAKELSDQEVREAAEWFASLPRGKWIRVVEAKTVPKTFVGQGRMRFVDPNNAGMEPIGSRIIMLPEDQTKARLRDPRSGFVAYVYAQAEKGQERLTFAPMTFLMPILASPIVFIPLLTIAAEVNSPGILSQSKLMVYLVAFQNGFFWKSFFEQRRRESAEGARAQHAISVPAQYPAA